MYLANRSFSYFVDHILENEWKDRDGSATSKDFLVTFYFLLMTNNSYSSFSFVLKYSYLFNKEIKLFYLFILFVLYLIRWV